MNEQWSRFLQDAGAVVDGGIVRSFDGDFGLRYAARGCFVCDLSEWGLIAFDGPEAEAFLHGQLSSDVKALGVDRCQLATYNTPKGRVLASLLLWRSAEGFLAQLPAPLAAGIARRLSMFVLRAKLTVDHASDRYIRLGLGGPEASQVLSAAGLRVASESLRVMRGSNAAGAAEPAYVLTLPAGRYELLYTSIDAAVAAWKALRANGARPAGAAPWQWLSVRSGIAEIGARTQDKFVPQMLNLELVGAVCFSKGCYPGQEIVARTQYRGEIKRRTVLVHFDAVQSPLPGDEIVDARAPAQALGSLVVVAAAPSGGYDALACVHLDLAHDADLRLNDKLGPRLQVMALPYQLPVTV